VRPGWKFELTPFVSLAKMIHYMHYQEDKPNAANKHLKAVGTFWHSVDHRLDLLDAIFIGLPHATNRNSDLQAIRTYLNATTLSTDNHIDAIAKRLLLALRLRNMTSPSSNRQMQE
jgi:hypothetical protein